MSWLKRAFRYILNPRAELTAMGDAGGNAALAHPSDETLAVPVRYRARQVLKLPLIAGSVVLIGLFLVVLFGPLMARQNMAITSMAIQPGYNVELGESVRLPVTPSDTFPLGSDQWGNDMLSLILYGARVTLIAGALITVMRILLGTAVGSLAGWYQGRLVDQIALGFIAVIASLPMLLSSMIIILALNVQKGLGVFVIALTIIGWTETAQFVRGKTIVIREMAYIEGAEAVGLTSLQIVVRHVLPNIIPQLLVFAFLEMGAVLFLMAELGFLGIFIGGGALYSTDPVFGGPPQPLMEVPEWGVMLATGAASLRSNPHLVWGPAIAFAIAIFGLNAVGEGLRRVMEDSPISTSFILSRRMLPIAGAVILLGWWAFNFTAPERSYALAAEGFNGQRAYEDVVALVGMDAEETAVYITEQFRENEIDRGVYVGINSSYEYQTEEMALPALVGFQSGFDFEISRDAFIVFSTYTADGTANAHTSGVAVMLELMRQWNEQEVDPRRSVLYIAWPADELDAAPGYLHDPEQFVKLPIPVRDGISDGPVGIFQLNNVGAGGNNVWIDPNSNATLAQHMSDSAGQVGLNTTSTPADDTLVSEQIPSVAIEWVDGRIPPAEDTLDNIQSAKLQSIGEMLSLTLIRVTREETYLLE